MLGLGDVVLPGIMIGLALRFDLFLFYLRQQKRVPAAEEGGEAVIEKPRYFSLAGRWSDHFWTHSLSGRPLFATTNSARPEPPFTFPKTYFKASIAGYIAGMLATLGVMHVWGHAQPALLYLVPGVLGSLWLTALAKGELGLMWGFSEAVEEEDDSASTGAKEGETKEITSSNRTSFFSLSDKKSQEREARMKKTLSKHITADNDSDEEDITKSSGIDRGSRDVKEGVEHSSEREVFSFSIEAPYKLKHPRSVRRPRRSVSDDPHQSLLDAGKPNWAPPSAEQKAEEPAGKRIRLN
jgi:minor histocompatibility antigen H13